MQSAARANEFLVFKERTRARVSRALRQMLLFARLASLLAVFANKRPVRGSESAAQVQVESVYESRQVRSARAKKSVLRKSESFSKLESHFSSSSSAWRQGNRARRREKSQEEEDQEPPVASCSAQVGDNLKCADLACVGHEAATAKQLEDHSTSSKAQEVQQVNKEHAHKAAAIDLPPVCGQLLTLICALLLLLYAIDFVQRQMANLFNKLLGSGSGVGNSNQQPDQRRRSLAAAGSSGSSSSQRQAAAPPLAAPGKINKSSSTRSIAQPQSSSQQQQQQQPKSQTLQSQQQAAAAASSSSRRSSRSSIHSLFSALMGGTGPNASNGRSIIAKNKEDTVIASSPTIIQKEGSESSVSGGQGGAGGGGAPSPGASAPGPTTPSGATPSASPQMNGPQLMNQVAAASTVGSPLASILGVSQAIGAQQMRTGGGGGGGAVVGQQMTPGEVAELVLADQFLYDTARNPLNSITNVFALAAAAATEQPGSSSSSSNNNNSIAGTGAIVPSVSTQMARNGDELIGGGGRGPGQQHHQAAGQQHPPQHPTHGQLSSSGTIKSAGGGPGSPVGSQAGAHSSPRASISSGPLATVQAMRRHEIITHTELLLNALNQGDYDTYTRLCDPHMTSFEPENCGHLIDNMELRRLAVDQARQLQIHHHLATFSGQQAVASAVAMAAAAAAVAGSISPAQGNSNTSLSQNSTNTSSGVSSGGGGESQRIQQIALAAAQAALASLNLNNPTSPYQTSSSCASQQQQQQKSYSLMVNPQVCLLGDDGATIAYTKLSYSIELASGQVARVEQSEETRVWLRRGPANDSKRSWVCVHLHRSLVTSKNYNNDCNGPLTSLALLRAMGQQQRLAQLAEVQQIQQQQQQNVPSISLNNKGQQQPR